MNDTGKQKYFEEALSDFIYDAASGRAIRHLADIGYTTAQIMEELHYPVPRAKVEKTVYKHLLNTGILSEMLPFAPEQFTQVVMQNVTENMLYACLTPRIRQNGEDHSYISCPFGIMRATKGTKLQEMLSPLTSRERDYILGIAWEPIEVFHKLNHRMFEIGIQLAANSGAYTFYFLKTMESIFIPGSNAFVRPPG